jgi:hypothetical protein
MCSAGWPVAPQVGRLLPDTAACVLTAHGRETLLFSPQDTSSSESGHWPRKANEPRAPIRAPLPDAWEICLLLAHTFSCPFKSGFAQSFAHNHAFGVFFAARKTI